MRSVTYAMSVSLDGYIVGPDGDFDWTAPELESPRSGSRSRRSCSPPRCQRSRGSNVRLASGGLAEQIERSRAEPGEGDIAIGGARLAAEAAASGLIDEYRVMVYPVLVGGGVPFFPQRERRVDLELVETRTFSSTVVYLLRYRLAR
jgi:dihydrofolate reductase